MLNYRESYSVVISIQIVLYHARFSIYFFPEVLTVWDVTFNSLNNGEIVMSSTVANHTPASLARRKTKRSKNL